MQQSGHHQHPSDDDDRHNRFTGSPSGENGSGSPRERAASQPPRSSEQTFVSSPSQGHFIPSSLSGNRSPWTNHRIVSPTRGVQPVPIRSSSFSAQSQGQFGSAMRERAFPSTFEDDESEGLSDVYDERYVPPSLSRGRTYGQDISRSRSQSLATPTTRPGPVGSPYLGGGGATALQSWNESFLSNPLNIPGRYGEIKPPGNSRYGSLGTLVRSPSNNYSSSPSGGSVVGNGHSNRQTVDISNMSPFVRDVGQILLDDGSAFRELWAGMNPPRDENGGGGSGTTSRRHSVSVVQPRRGNIVGFNVPGGDGTDEPSRPSFTQSFGGRGGLLLSDDDLASDLGLLNINPNEPPPPSSSQHPPSQPSSLPIYAPLSRSPPSRDLISPYQSINLTIPSSYSSRNLGTPSDGGLSAGGNSPSVSSNFDQHFAETYGNGSTATRQSQSQSQQQPELTARFIPGQGIQYLPPQSTRDTQGSPYTRARAPSYSNAGMPSPISPSSTRLINPQQQPFYPQQLQRRPSDAPQPALTDLGKGVPLHAVPASWPLFIVEFKAGRTDLFYLTDLSQDIRIGDLVIVEADRGKDLGKVVNDSITLAEVEAFQKQQQERAGFGDGQPTSPGGAGSSAGPGAVGKKEINPKMIYGKAQQQDAQLLVSKMQDEVKALQLCQSKVRAKKLPMEVVDAEYQWDRRKLTFYFIAEKRIDFRELVRELFRLYKTRIWMASLQGGGGFEP
ncbi:hypothetical protein D9615_007253 [Tricholomella constricta]|uniref:PSP1 C-terminal domain-containing protein n=1 Tax=Tricholomella constricta TaxID=117010 RepID=A0A8H5H591_9AGAR|nr:hypothetical protein D9615_007253 [Tricholomella constricta]